MLLDLNAYVGHWPFQQFRITTCEKLLAKMNEYGTDVSVVTSLHGLFYKNVQSANEELLEEIWGVDEELGVTTRTVDTHVSNLRSKLGDGFDKPFIVAVHKVGYKFVEP